MSYGDAVTWLQVIAATSQFGSLHYCIVYSNYSGSIDRLDLTMTIIFDVTRTSVSSNCSTASAVALIRVRDETCKPQRLLIVIDVAGSSSAA